MKKSISLSLKLGVLATALGCTMYPRNQADPLPERTMNVSVVEAGQTNSISIPVYSLDDVPGGHCSQYARLCAEKVFDKEYTKNSAWNRRYADKVVVPFGEIRTVEDLEGLAKNGKLKPGNLVGVYNAQSKHLGDIDKNGKNIKYTHNVIYLGKSSNDKMLFAQQYGKSTEIIDSDAMKLRNLKPREILDENSTL